MNKIGIYNFNKSIIDYKDTDKFENNHQLIKKIDNKFIFRKKNLTNINRNKEITKNFNTTFLKNKNNILKLKKLKNKSISNKKELNFKKKFIIKNKSIDKLKIVKLNKPEVINKNKNSKKLNSIDFKNSCNKIKDNLFNKYNFNKKKLTFGNKKWYTIKNKLFQYLRFFINNNLDLLDLKLKVKFPSIPYESENSKKFIECCKFGENFDIIKLLGKNKILLFEYDYMGMTGLHWAAKRGQLSTVKLLISYHCELNIVDIFERTPLFYAIESNSMEICKIFLINKCMPIFFGRNKILIKFALKNNSKLEYLIDKFKNYIFIYKFKNNNDKDIWWELTIKKYISK